ncbi:MaoC family dehydratase [Streptococcus suis]|nr:MaoC family dehydratase [Streptococcus suis]MBY5039652.1 MaoC family dehydratase [Streptococcus suis]
MMTKVFEVGQTGSFSKTITETDVVLFAGISGDLNPAHINEVEASKGMFKKRIAHGMLGASLISTVLGMYLPGPGTIYLGQNLKFLKPVAIGDTLTAMATIVEKDEKGWLKLETTVTNQEGVVVISGHAKVIPPK